MRCAVARRAGKANNLARERAAGVELASGRSRSTTGEGKHADRPSICGTRIHLGRGRLSRRRISRRSPAASRTLHLADSSQEDSCTASRFTIAPSDPVRPSSPPGWRRSWLGMRTSRCTGGAVASGSCASWSTAPTSSIRTGSGIARRRRWSSGSVRICGTLPLRPDASVQTESHASGTRRQLDSGDRRTTSVHRLHLVVQRVSHFTRMP